MNFCRINGISHVVTRAILNISNKTFILADCFKNCFNNIDIRFFIMTADIIYLADLTVFKDHVDRLTMVVNIEPVTDIESLAVNGELFVGKSL